MKTGHKVVKGLKEAVAHEKITRLEEEVEEHRKKYIAHADLQIKWIQKEAALMRVIFHLSDALEHAQGRRP
jgi:hypothetical protein